MKRFLLCIAALSFYVNLHAKVVITGQVTDETTSPIIGAVVKLVTQTTLITQTVTNNEGLFNLTMEESDGHKELIITLYGDMLIIVYLWRTHKGIPTLERFN